MAKLLFLSVSLIAIGIATILMEDMVRTGQMSNHSWPPGLICDYAHAVLG